MKNKSFNPNDVGVPNGNYFGFPYSEKEANILLLSVPWDVTTSYGNGAAQAPKAIIEASTQLDFFDSEINDAWKFGIGTIPVDEEISAKNIWLRSDAEKVIAHLEAGGEQNDLEIQENIQSVNLASEELNIKIYDQTLELLKVNKLIGLVGGDHSTPYGFIKALSEIHEEFGILQIDAHADLRKAYEGFNFSHASIMYNVLQIENIKKIVQVGIRDLCEEEASIITKDERLETFYDFKIKENDFAGITWAEQCKEIISKLPENIYISFDIDGLQPAFCPNTGTPVPGGLTFNEALYLIKSILLVGKKIIGFDLCEVAQGNDEFDANVGARLLYKLCNLMYKSNNN